MHTLFDDIAAAIVTAAFGLVTASAFVAMVAGAV